MVHGVWCVGACVAKMDAVLVIIYGWNGTDVHHGVVASTQAA